MKKLMWIDEKCLPKVKELDPEAVPVELVGLSENAVLVTYLGRGVSLDQFQKVSRKYKLMLEDSISALEQHTKRKFELVFAQDENHMRKLDAGTMAKLGWFRASK